MEEKFILLNVTWGINPPNIHPSPLSQAMARAVDHTIILGNVRYNVYVQYSRTMGAQARAEAEQHVHDHLLEFVGGALKNKVVDPA